MAAGDEPAKAVKGQLRVVSSAGEPLNPEVIHWFEKALGAPIKDHYGQTELGMVVNNHHRLKHPVHPGSAGLPMPGHRVVVLDRDGGELGPEQPGELSIDMARSPLHFFRGYHQQPTPAISGGYYRTGDDFRQETDGRFTFIGRNDDVITSAGYRIGPFEVESALIEHPAVGEAAAIGKPDPERTEIVKAFVVLRQGYSRATRSPRTCAATCASGSRRTPIRARSHSSTSCRRRRVEKSNASCCASRSGAKAAVRRA